MSCMTVYEDTWTPPDDFAGFYQTYRPFVRSIGKRVGVPHDYLDDMVDEVFTRMLELNMLPTYDPTQVPFARWLASYVSLKMMGLRDRLLSRKREVPFGLKIELLMVPAGDAWTETTETMVDLRTAMEHWRHDQPTVYDTWIAAQRCVTQTGELQIDDLSAHTRLSRTGASARLWEFRRFASKATGLPMPARRKRTPKPPA